MVSREFNFSTFLLFLTFRALRESDDVIKEMRVLTLLELYNLLEHFPAFSTGNDLIFLFIFSIYILKSLLDCV